MSKFSVIIPATDERFSLEQIIEKLNNQTYPQDFFEVIIGFDGNRQNFEFFQQKTTSLKNFSLEIEEDKIGKKGLLKLLIAKTKNDNILQIDADVAIPQTMLQGYNQLLRMHKPDCIIGGVKPQVEEIDDFFVKLFGLDFLSLQGVQIATLYQNNPGMANGANLLYTKESYYAVVQELENIKSESGDDTFLVQFLNKLGKNIIWADLSECQVTSPIPQSISEFLNQRARWGSKTNEYINLNYKILAYLTLFGSVSLLLSIFFWLGGKVLFVGMLFLFGLKGIVDYLLLRNVIAVYDQNYLLKNMVLNTFIYPFLLVIAAFKAIFGLYTWK